MSRLVEEGPTGWIVIDEADADTRHSQDFHEWSIVEHRLSGEKFRLIAHGDSYTSQSYVQLEQWTDVGWEQVIREADPTPEIGGGYVGVDRWTPGVRDWFERLLAVAGRFAS